jgi:hypothetical protein
MVVMGDDEFEKCNRCCLCENHENFNFIICFVVFLSYLLSLATAYNNDADNDNDIDDDDDDDDDDDSFKIDTIFKRANNNRIGINNFLFQCAFINSL